MIVEPLPLHEEHVKFFMLLLVQLAFNYLEFI